jgi:hypothetical protein
MGGEVKREIGKSRGRKKREREGFRDQARFSLGGNRKAAMLFFFSLSIFFFWFPILGGETRIVGMYREI